MTSIVSSSGSWLDQKNEKNLRNDLLHDLGSRFGDVGQSMHRPLMRISELLMIVS
jgi:hypothetical protein